MASLSTLINLVRRTRLNLESEIRAVETEAEILEDILRPSIVVQREKTPEEICEVNKPETSEEAVDLEEVQVNRISEAVENAQKLLRTLKLEATLPAEDEASRLASPLVRAAAMVERREAIDHAVGSFAPKSRKDSRNKSEEIQLKVKEVGSSTRASKRVTPSHRQRVSTEDKIKLNPFPFLGARPKKVPDASRPSRQSVSTCSSRPRPSLPQSRPSSRPPSARPTSSVLSQPYKRTSSETLQKQSPSSGSLTGQVLMVDPSTTTLKTNGNVVKRVDVNDGRFDPRKTIVPLRRISPLQKFVLDDAFTEDGHEPAYHALREKLRRRRKLEWRLGRLDREETDHMAAASLARKGFSMETASWMSGRTRDESYRENEATSSLAYLSQTCVSLSFEAKRLDDLLVATLDSDASSVDKRAALSTILERYDALPNEALVVLTRCQPFTETKVPGEESFWTAAGLDGAFRSYWANMSHVDPNASDLAHLGSSLRSLENWTLSTENEILRAMKATLNQRVFRYDASHPRYPEVVGAISSLLNYLGTREPVVIHD